MKYHKELTLEKWSKLSKQEQIMNISAEVSRAQYWQNLKDTKKVKECIERALELLDLTLQDKRWEDKLGDILRIREGLASFYVYDSAPIMYKFYLDWLTQFAQSK